MDLGIIPLQQAQSLLKRIDVVKENHKKYMAKENDINNIYIEHEDIKFIIYRDGGDKIRVFGMVLNFNNIVI